MKYIRTKDGKVKKSKDFTTDELWNYENETDNILKQSDTIEELCDEFIGVVGNMHRQLTGTNIRFWNDCTIYGAIWTDKGLQFVARMNSKGELELL